MSVHLGKVFYVLENPLDCLFYAKSLIRAAEGTPVYVLLPKHIDPSRFEHLLLQDADVFSGVDIQVISSFPRNVMTSIGYFDLPQRVDQIELSEHFSGRIPRGLARPVLNAVLELKQADFESDYLKFLGAEVLVEVFEEYQRFLRSKNLFDDADYKKLFVSEVLSPGSNIIDTQGLYIFAGFHEFSSFDLDIIKAVSSKAAGTFIVGPDVLNMDIEYSRLLNEQMISMGFKTINVKDERTTVSKIHEFSNINDEVFYISQNLDQAVIYAPSDVETYYSLLRYHLGEEKVAINAVMRLDRTQYLTSVCTLLQLNSNGWIYSDVAKVLNFAPLWKDQDTVLKLVSASSKGSSLPRGYKVWLELAEQQKNKEVYDFIKAVVETIPIKASPSYFEKALKGFIKGKDDLEADSVMNLVIRVTACLEDKPMTSQDLVRKLYEHAEENYVKKGYISYKPITTTLASLVAANTSKKVWFAGMNQDSFISMKKEDVVMSDKAILSFRAEGFLYPTSKERALITNKIIRDASSKENSSYLPSVGPVVEHLAGATVHKHTKIFTPVLDGAMSTLGPNDIELDGPKFPLLSVSLLKSYMQCPYIFLAQRILKIESQDVKELSLRPQDVGNILHAALESLLPKKLSDEELNIETELEQLLNTEKFKWLLAHPLKRVFVKYYATIIENFLKKEVEFMRGKGLSLFERTEKKFQVSLDITEGLPLKGKIDRIDIDKQNNKLYVADYKTSKIPTATDIRNGEEIQLAAYIMAMAAEYPQYDYDGYYISIKGLERTNLKITSLDDAKNILAIRTPEAVKGIKKGLYTPRPMDPDMCEKCDYRRCCGAV